MSLFAVFRALWNGGPHWRLCSLYSIYHHLEDTNFRWAPLYTQREKLKSILQVWGNLARQQPHGQWIHDDRSRSLWAREKRGSLGALYSELGLWVPAHLLPAAALGPLLNSFFSFPCCLSFHPLPYLLLPSSLAIFSDTLALEVFLVKFLHSFKSYNILQHFVLFRGQLLQNLISHNKHSSGGWDSGDALGIITALLGLLHGYLKGVFFSPLNFASFVYEMVFIIVFLWYLVGYQLKLKKMLWGSGYFY